MPEVWLRCCYPESHSVDQLELHFICGPELCRALLCTAAHKPGARLKHSSVHLGGGAPQGCWVSLPEKREHCKAGRTESGAQRLGLHAVDSGGDSQNMDLSAPASHPFQRSGHPSIRLWSSKDLKFLYPLC